MKSPTDEVESYRILELRALNFMGLQAVQIRPDGTVVEITGDNEQGKTSTIKAISWALGGKAFAEDMPLRRGEDRGEVSIDLGALRVTKTMERDKTDPKEIAIKLSVQFANGSKPAKPQHVLDELRGMLMDPVAFARADGAGRIEMVKSLFPEFDFKANEMAIAETKKERTDVGREQKRAAGARDAVVLPKGPKPERVVIADAGKQLAEANAHNSQLENRKRRREKVADDAEQKRDEAERLRARARELEAEAGEMDKQLADAPALPDPIDVAPLMEAIANAEKVNGHVALFEQYERHSLEANRLKSQYDSLTAKIDALDKERDDALYGGELPAGMTFGNEEVFVDGVPFGQLAFSRKLSISCSIAIAIGSQIKVMLVSEFGSLLDKNHMQMLADVCAKNAYQIWIETVGAGGPGKVLIEDGRVRQ